MRTEGAGGGGSGTQKCVSQKWPKSIIPFVKFLLSDHEIWVKGGGCPPPPAVVIPFQSSVGHPPPVSCRRATAHRRRLTAILPPKHLRLPSVAAGGGGGGVEKKEHLLLKGQPRALWSSAPSRLHATSALPPARVPFLYPPGQGCIRKGGGGWLPPPPLLPGSPYGLRQRQAGNFEV